MDWACGKYGRQEKYIQGLAGDLRERNYLKGGGKIILKRIFKKWDGGIDWTDVAQGSVRWRDFVNAIMNLQVP
jgi:hypothetical protein